MVQLRSVCWLLLALMLWGCGAYSQVAVDSELAAYAGPPPTRGPAGPYILGPGDKVRVKVYEDANVTGEYEVDSAGYISVPLVGQVRAAGLTTRKLEQTLMSRMKGDIAKDPKINVEMATYAPFYVHGEVKKAGVYPFQPGITLADAIATAGGFTYRANENLIFVQRANSPEAVPMPLLGTVRVFPGDNIRVAERFF
jgi:polysaccharide biosynthesis/export protein